MAPNRDLKNEPSFAPRAVARSSQRHCELDWQGGERLNHLTNGAPCLQSLLSRVEIGDTTLTVTVALGRLREALKLPVLSADEPRTHAIVVPVRITKRGIEQKLIIGDGVMATIARDEALVKAVARAYSWFEDIRMRRVNDLSELAIREQLTRSYVQAHLPLAFLAPSIVGAILEGRQPADLSLKQLMYRTDLAVSWITQRQQLGIET